MLERAVAPSAVVALLLLLLLLMCHLHELQQRLRNEMHLVRAKLRLRGLSLRGLRLSGVLRLLRLPRL